MCSREELWRRFVAARDAVYAAQERYSRVIEDRRPAHAIDDAEADLTVAEALYREAARRWLDADRGDVA